MRTRMPHVIDAYIQASNSRNADRFGYQCLRKAPAEGVGSHCERSRRRLKD
jgi:hypothetical protein